MARKRKSDDPDELLLRRFQRAAGDFRNEFHSLGARAEGGHGVAELSNDERRCVLAHLSELANVLKLMIARKNEIGHQLNRARGHRAAVSAYARTGALAGVSRRNN
jgi:hypothetical protein